MYTIISARMVGKATLPIVQGEERETTISPPPKKEHQRRFPFSPKLMSRQPIRHAFDILCTYLVRPEKWDDSQVGFRGGNASGGRIVLLQGAF